MNFITVYSLLIFPTFILFAQNDSSYLERKDKKLAHGDSLKNKIFLKPFLPPRILIIKMKDLNEIKNLKVNPFIVIDDTSNFSADELAGGLTEEELAAYKKNKRTTNSLIKPPPSEEETYPTVAKIRSILGVAKIIGVIIILLLSIL